MMAKLAIPLPDKLKKSMFWIVIGVLALMLTIIWWLGTSTVAGMTEAGITARKGYFTTVESAVPTANDKTVKAMMDQVDARKKSMYGAWQEVYDAQTKELVWPEVELDANGSVIKPGLPSEFVEKARGLPPPEWLPPPGRVEPLEPHLKEMYRNYAKRQIADLCAIVGANERSAEGNSSGRQASRPGQGTDDAAQPNEICVWPAASQQNAAAMLSFAEGANPLTQDIMYAQESVWVYEALFKIIRATNDSFKETSPNNDPPQHYNAPVKRIHEISIGPNFSIKEANANRQTYGNSYNNSSDEGEIKTPDVLLAAEKRYVNERGKRLKGEELLALGRPDPNDPSRITAQYKLMPVYMRMDVDQRYWGRLLAECANSPLTVEVKDVAFNVTGHADRETGAMQDTGFNEGPKQNTNFYDLTVDITGHIYLYYDPKGGAAPATEEPAPEDAGTPADATAQAGG